MILADKVIAHFVVESYSPVERRRTGIPAHDAEIVDDVPAADDEHAFVAQWGKSFTEIVVERGRLCCIEAELHDRYIGFGKNMCKHRPGAVIQSPALIKFNINRGEKIAQPARKFGGTRRRILKIE